MTKASDLYKGGTVFFYCPPERKPVELLVLMAEGPLCVAKVYDHWNKETVEGLYWIYLRKHGAHFGPFFAEVSLAHRAMRKVLKEFKPTFFEQPLAWIRRQAVLKEWVEKNVGKSEDLVGGEWIKEPVSKKG